MNMPRESAEVWERSASFVERPLLSALCFVYGAERFMRGLLDDLLAQTILPRMEIVIVDTGSPTNEAAIVREYLAKYPNIAYLRTPERETTTSAANRCVAAARGKYLTLACADDRHRRDALERMVDVLERNPDKALAYADVAITDTENESADHATVVGHLRWPDFDARRLFQVCAIGPQPVYRRRLHEQYGGYDANYVTAGDYEFWLRVVGRGEQFVHVPEVLGVYLRSQSSNEHANQGLSVAESEKARIVHWPEAWGARPAPGGCYLTELPMPQRMSLNAAAPSAPAPRVAAPALAPPTIAPVPPAIDAMAMLAEAAATARAASSNAPLVSVIMPTFDRPDFLPRAVASVLAQTYPNLELIVVNDAGCPVEDLLRPLDPDGRITYLRLRENRNRSAARNAGLALARGKYVAYLDDDDWYLPTHLERLVGLLEQSGDAVAYSYSERVTEERREDGWVQTEVLPIYRMPYLAARLLVGNFIPMPCLVHRRDCLDLVGTFDEDMITHEDWDLLIRLSARWPFQQLEETTCRFSWRQDGSSTTSSHRHDFPRTLQLVYERYADLAARFPGVAEAQQQELVRAHARARQGAAESAARSGDAAPTCSIIIPLYNRAELTRQCLTALAEVTQGVSAEVILVDNASSDETPQLLAQLGGGVRVIRNDTNLGFAKACNQGAAAARGRYLVFLNNDTVPLQGWLSALVDVVEHRPEVSVVGSKLLYPDGTLQHAGVVFSHKGQAYHLYSRLPGDFAPANRSRELQVVTGACMLVRTDAFRAVSGFDEGFVNSFEDVDLCLRLRERGGRVVYEPKSVLYHLESQTAGRHANDDANGARLVKRWKHVSLADHAGAMLEDGLVLRMSDLEGSTHAVLEHMPSDERPRWQLVAEAERLASESGFAATAPVLADADAWPADPGVLSWAALELCPRAGVPELAIAFWERLLACEESAAARAALATAALEHGDLTTAEEHVATLLARRPDDARGFLVRGVLELQRENYVAARDAFGRARAGGADERKSTLGLGMAALGAGAAEDAWHIFSDLVRERPDDAEAMHWLLRAGCVLERWRGLRPFVADSVARAPRDASLRFALAGIHVRLGDLDAARTEYLTLRETAPALDGLDSLASALDGRLVASPTAPGC
jgi:GT2 family glycosyltransferase/thioredoxin-like negative regulator of GroEL